MIPIMAFIDGTNVLVELAKLVPGGSFRADKPPPEAITLAADVIRKSIENKIATDAVIRAYWFASYRGSDEFRVSYSTWLRGHGYEPRLFPRVGDKEKGVDIDLTREMLVNAFSRNFQIALLIAGDADYVSLVHEVKRYGARVYGAFFEGASLSPELWLSLDRFYGLGFKADDSAFEGPVGALLAARRSDPARK